MDFDLPEARVVLGSGGEPVDIQRIARLESHRLVEDFMLLANEIVAREAVRRRLPILHRVHEPPTEQKVSAPAGFPAVAGSVTSQECGETSGPRASARARARTTRGEPREQGGAPFHAARALYLGKSRSFRA